jgi:hypothetical protein
MRLVILTKSSWLKRFSNEKNPAMPHMLFSF